MIGDDEAIFSGKYKGLELNVRYDLKGASEKDAAGALVEIVKKIEPFAYEFSEIDCKKVEEIALKAGKDLASVVKYIRENPVRKMLEGTVKDAKLVSASESYFFNRVLTNAGVALLPDVKTSIKPETEKVEGQIVFVGKYGKWVAIKKLAIEGVKNWEVSGLLSGMVQTAVNKAFEFTGESGEVSTGKRRKSFGAAADLLEGLAGKDTYTIVKSLENLGYAPYAHPGMLTAAHPEIKPPKPRGRMPKG
jgi:hypothetical protein